MLPAKKAGSTPTPPSFAAQDGRRWTCCFPPQSFADSAVRRKATSPAKERLTPITIRLQPSCLLFLEDSENSHHGSRLHAGRRSEKTRTGSVMPCVSGTCSRTPGRRKPKAPRQGAADAAYLNAAVTEPERPLSRTPEGAPAPCLRPRRLSAAPETSQRSTGEFPSSMMLTRKWLYLFTLRRTVIRRTILMGLRPARTGTTPRPRRLRTRTSRAEAHVWSMVLASATDLRFGGSGVRTPKLRRRKTVTPLPTRPGGPKLPPCRVVKLVTDLRKERLTPPVVHCASTLSLSVANCPPCRPLPP